MAIFTAAEITEQKTAWKAALLAVASGQSYTIKGRTLTRAEIPDIRSMLEFLDAEEAKINAGGTAGPAIIPGRVAR